jgi:hypothetical protein
MTNTEKTLDSLIREVTVLRNMPRGERDEIRIAILQNDIDDCRIRLGLAQAA